MNEAWTRHTVPEEDNFDIYDKYSQMEFNEHWRRLLLDFGSRNLTYSSDVLPASSGVTQIFAADLEDEYMAGIWKIFPEGPLMERASLLDYVRKSRQ